MSRFITIDDSAMIRMRLKTAIESCGHEVVGEAGDGKEGVSLYKELKPDVVTLDISMPQQDGIETLKQILELNSEAKVIIISALGQKQTILEAFELGARDFVTKPFELEQVKEIIKNLIGP